MFSLLSTSILTMRDCIFFTKALASFIHLSTSAPVMFFIRLCSTSFRTWIMSSRLFTYCSSSRFIFPSLFRGANLPHLEEPLYGKEDVLVIYRDALAYEIEDNGMALPDHAPELREKVWLLDRELLGLRFCKFVKVLLHALLQLGGNLVARVIP